MPANHNVLLTILPVFWPKMVPVGLGYLQCYLAKNNIKAEILDLNNYFYNLADEGLKREWLVSCNSTLENGILSIIKDNYSKEIEAVVERLLGYGVLGFSCFKSNFKTTLEVAAILKSRRPDIKIIFGGPEISRLFFKGNGKFDNEIMELADFLVVGEGEKALCEVFKERENLVDKVIVFNELADLRGLDFPIYEGIEFKDYPRKDALPVQFSRGCIRKCAFCSERLLYKGFRRRQVDVVIDEIKYHRAKNKINYFVFFDSLINADLNALEDFCDGIIENFGSLNWEAQIAVRPDMPDGLFKKIKASGCYNLFVGLESGSDRTLKQMNKGFISGEAVNFFRKLNNAGLFFGVSMIVGYPGETDEDFKQSLDFIIRNKEIIPKIEQVNPFTYYEGTALDRKADYKFNNKSLERMEVFVREIKKYGFRYTNAFIGNLVEK
ncbi:MAG: radical SAM protein [Candidatus Omnitrophota bacterium]